MKFLDGLLEEPESTDDDDTPEALKQRQQQTNYTIQLAREELSHHVTDNDEFLKVQVTHVIQQWCGSQHDPPKRKKALAYHCCAAFS